MIEWDNDLAAERELLLLQYRENRTVLAKVINLLDAIGDNKVRLLDNASLLDRYIKTYHPDIVSIGDYARAREDRKVPALETILRSIRKAREIVPAWRRPLHKIEAGKQHVKQEAKLRSVR